MEARSRAKAEEGRGFGGGFAGDEKWTKDDWARSNWG